MMRAGHISLPNGLDHLGKHLLLGDLSHERPPEEVTGSNPALVVLRDQAEPSIERHHCCSQLGYRIRVHEAASEGSAVPDGVVPDMRNRLSEHRHLLGHTRVREQSSMTYQCAKAQAAIGGHLDGTQIPGGR